MNLSEPKYDLVESLVELAGEDNRGDIEIIVHETLDALLKDYALLRDYPYGESFNEMDEYYDEVYI